jgi:hypothetical protein
MGWLLRQRCGPRWLIRLTLILSVGAVHLAPAATNDDAVPTVAFFGFELINTSLQPTTPAELRRLGQLDMLFRERLGQSHRFTLAAIPPGVQRQAAAGAAISGCNGCERGFAKQAGADWAAWGTVQKVSELILNINLYMEDASTGKLEFVKSVDIRGNTDESWRRGLDYLIKNYLLAR